MADTPIPPKSPPDEVEAIVDEVVEGFADLLPPEVLGEARTFVLDALAAHPVGAQLAERVRPREVDRSGERGADGEPIDETPGKAGGGLG